MSGVFNRHIVKNQLRSGAVCMLLVAAFLAVPGNAFSEPGWAESKNSEVRVLHSPALSDMDGNRFVIGLHVKMRKGWKTYWRRPGDSGIPPFFDWKGSENVGSVEVLWPAPKRLKDAYGTSIGYKDEVVFPVVIRAKDAGRPVSVKLNFGFGVCAEICIPEEKNLAFALPDGSSNSLKDHRLLSGFYRKVPVQTGIDAEGGSRKPVIRSVEMKLDSKNPYIDLNVEYSEGAEAQDIFVEASDGFYLSDPRLVQSGAAEKGGGTRRYRIDLTKGDKVKDLKGKTITVTLVSSIGQSETAWVVK